MAVRLLTADSPAGLLEFSARHLAREAGEDTCLVVPRAWMLRELRDQVLGLSGEEAWLGARVLTLDMLLEHYLSHLPGKPGLTPAQVRQIVAAVIQEMHRESRGEQFRGQVVGSRVSGSTLRSLTHLILELEPLDLDPNEFRARLAGDEADPPQRVREVTEVFRRYSDRLRRSGYLGPKGQILAAADSASRQRPPHGLRRFRVLGVDGQLPGSPYVRWIDAVAQHPDVEEVEVVLVLPEDVHESAWSLHANLPLYQHWTAEGEARTLLGSGGADDVLEEQLDELAPDLRALVTTPFDFRKAPVETTGAVRGRRLPDEPLEIEWVASEIKRRVLEEDLSLERVAVVARDMADRASDITGTFDAMGIPTVASVQRLLSDIPAVRALLSVFRLPAEGWRLDNLIAVAESPYLPFDLSPALLQNVARRGTAPEGKEQWQQAIESYAELLEFEGRPGPGGIVPEDVREVGERLADFRRQLRDLCGGADFMQVPARWARALVRATEVWGLEEQIYAPHTRIPTPQRLDLARADLDGLTEFLHRVNDWLRGREVAGLEDDALHVEEWFEEVRALAEGTRVRLSTYPQSAVHVVEPTQAAFREFDFVYVVGLVDGVFPSGPRPGAYALSEAERQAVSLPTRDFRAARERLLFQFACASARRELVLVAPAADTRGRALVTSPLLTHLGLRLEGFEIETLAARDVIPADEVDVRAPRHVDLLATRRYREITDPTRSAAEVRELLGRDPLVSVWYGRSGTARALQAWAVEDVRAQLDEILERNPLEQTELFQHIPPYGEFAGMLRPDQVPAWIRAESATFSPSDFGSYERCAWRFFVEKVLGLRAELTDEEEHNEAGAFGSLQHRILERLYSDLLEEGCLPPEDGAAVERALDRLEEVALQAVQEETGSAHRELWRLDLEFVLGVLRRFVRNDLTEMMRAATDPHYPELRTRLFALERFLGSDEHPIPAEALGERFRLRGRSDRVEEVADDRLREAHAAAAGSLIVRDYKTGKTARNLGPAQYLRGNSIQLPLYAYMVEQHQALYEDGPRIIYGFGITAVANEDGSGLLTVRRPRLEDDGTVTLLPQGGLGNNPVRQAQRAALETAARMVKAMRAGRFAPQLDRQFWGCPLGALCCQRGGISNRRSADVMRRRYEMPVRVSEEECEAAAREEAAAEVG